MFLSSSIAIAILVARTCAVQSIKSSHFGIPCQDASFDYVIVGGGTAGLTIAARLATNPSISVAVIEAGGFYEQDNGNYSVLPGLSLSSPFLAATEIFPQNPLVDWSLVSVPQIGALNRKIHYAQGKTLSGSSALNAMAYHRGTTGAYQRWADLVGDQSYTFDNLLPYFEKSCNFSPPDNAKRQTPNATVKYDTSVFSPKGGPLHVSYSNWVDVALTWFQRAFSNIALPISDIGFNSGSLTGKTAWITSTIDPNTGTRSSSQTSFLRQAIQNTNIIIYTQAQASKILFNGNTASGVSVTTQNIPFTISANKEVILSAGVYHSPQLLMLSGIGPRPVLEQHGIPVLSALPGVGQNLWDQPVFGIGHSINLPIQAQLITQPLALTEFLSSASGPFSSLNGLIAFEKIPRRFRSNFTKSASSALEEQFPPDWPEVEYIGATALFPNPASASGTTRTGLIEAALSAPLSRGNVTISSSSIADPPVINMNWFNDANNADAQVAIAAFKRMREAWASISHNSSQQDIIGPEILPGPLVATDAEILTFIRNTSIPLYHAGATCAMGKAGATNAVVDSRARVFGVQGLRVVDLSAAPFSPPGHPQATVYMLAEKIAEDILGGV